MVGICPNRVDAAESPHDTEHDYGGIDCHSFVNQDGILLAEQPLAAGGLGSSLAIGLGVVVAGFVGNGAGFLGNVR